METIVPSYRYFRDPHQYSDLSDEPQLCSFCGHIRLVYESLYAEEDDLVVCDECLSAGRLAEKDATTNEGDIRALRGQLQRLHPDLPAEAVERTVRERTAELEQRTPAISRWQDWWWPAHCGDYCRFLQTATKRDLATFAPDRNGRSFFEEHLYDDEADVDPEEVWEDIPRSEKEGDSPRVYVFQCLQCGEHVIRWDCD